MQGLDPETGVSAKSLTSIRVIPMTDAEIPATRVTLLTQLRQDPSDQAGWDEFVER